MRYANMMDHCRIHCCKQHGVHVDHIVVFALRAIDRFNCPTKNGIAPSCKVLTVLNLASVHASHKTTGHAQKHSVQFIPLGHPPTWCNQTQEILGLFSGLHLPPLVAIDVKTPGRAFVHGKACLVAPKAFDAAHIDIGLVIANDGATGHTRLGWRRLRDHIVARLHVRHDRIRKHLAQLSNRDLLARLRLAHQVALAGNRIEAQQLCTQPGFRVNVGQTHHKEVRQPIDAGQLELGSTRVIQIKPLCHSTSSKLICTPIAFFLCIALCTGNQHQMGFHKKTADWH